MRSVSVQMDGERNRSTNTREQLAKMASVLTKTITSITIQRIAVVEKYRSIYERQAAINKSLKGGNKKIGVAEFFNSDFPR